jgi:hypothetical protein
MELLEKRVLKIAIGIILNRKRIKFVKTDFYTKKFHVILLSICLELNGRLNHIRKVKGCTKTFQKYYLASTSLLLGVSDTWSSTQGGHTEKPKIKY